jgi:3,4-dihydroxy-2-butanone 4-phosphate synthase
MAVTALSPRDELRRALGVFATGVTVVTTRGAAGDYGMTVNSFTSVSLDPPLILVCVGQDSPGRTAIAANGVFAVNVLSAAQEGLSRRFAGRDRARGTENFAGIDHGLARTGSPVLTGAVAHLDCRVVTTHDAGDHVIFVGEVLEFRRDASLPPLLFHGGRYHALTGARAPDQGAAFASAEQAIAEIRAGRMVVVWDGENRQNEGDLTLAADSVSSGAINFMAREGRGLVSLALSSELCDRLALPPMSGRNESRFRTAFTVSIEAREGVATGISAADRARTIRVACDPGSDGSGLVRPGHVFPLRARPGGLLERRGHTEAAVELARLAGRAPAGVVCQVMNDDGTMARVPDLIGFCARHRLKMVSVAALIAHRSRAEIGHEHASAA